MLFTIWIIYMLFTSNFSQIAAENAYVIPNVAVQLACKIEWNAEFKHFFL